MNDTPYNNGKVKIGSMYCLNPLRRKYIEEDTDMLRLQKCLTNDPSIKEKEKAFKAVLLCIVLFIGFVVLMRLK
jgi:hypothetical protein